MQCLSPISSSIGCSVECLSDGSLPYSYAFKGELPQVFGCLSIGIKIGWQWEPLSGLVLPPWTQHYVFNHVVYLSGFLSRLTMHLLRIIFLSSIHTTPTFFLMISFLILSILIWSKHLHICENVMFMVPKILLTLCIYYFILLVSFLFLFYQ